MTPPRDNSRMGRVLPDVAAVDVPLVAALIAATAAFGEGRMAVAAFQLAVLAALRADDPRRVLAGHVVRAEEMAEDQTLARMSWPERDYTVQIIHVAAGEVHPCHCHHNVTSTQVVLTGTLRAREFDRVDAVDAETLRLRLLFDGTLRPGDFLQASDLSRNVHWFAAGEAPATMLNFNIRGYERETFWPLETRPLGRRLLDATEFAGDALVQGRILAPEAAYAAFGGRPLDDFPMPLAPAETRPRSL